MIRTLRAFFLRCLFREKLLLLTFALLGVVLWLSGLSGRVGRFWREQRTTTNTLADQARWLGNSAAIEASAQKAAAQLVASNTLDETRLVTTVSQFASEAGLHGFQSRGAVSTKTSGKFSIHTLECQISRISANDWPLLNKFYQALQGKAPYIGIEKFTLTMNGGQHALALTVSSVEITQ